MSRLKVSRTVLVGLVTILAVLISSGGLNLFEGLELSAYDTWFQLRHKPDDKGDSRFVIIGVDDASIKQIRRWPFDRADHAKLLDQLGQAKVVAFDIIFTDPAEKPGDDQALADAIRRHGRVVLTTQVRHTILKEKGGQINSSPNYPIKLLRDAAKEGKHKFAGEGVANTPTDFDAVVRANIAVDTDIVAEPYPSLALAAVLMYKGYSPADIKVKHLGDLTIKDITIKRDVDGQTLINYLGPPGTIETVSYADVYTGKIPPAFFKDKIVFVGATDPSLKDEFPTPFAKDSSIGALMPGVEIQATTAATYLNGDSFTRAPRSLNALIIIVMGLVTMLFASKMKALWGALSMLGLTGVYTVASYFSWLNAHYWLDVVAPATVAALVFSSTTLENYLREEAEKRRVRNMFGRYVSHNVVNELLSNPEALEMGGKRFNVTILFSDIRGFTSFSETRDPHEVVERINEYCQEMVQLIYNHGGTLDKYMGDGIMAYFGAPIPLEDHAERAITCAHEMREKMKELHERWTAAGKQTFKIGVGLNSGDVIAGNIGHTDRVEYSLIGSAVNLASRLESMTKEYAKSDYGGIVFSHNTYVLAPKAMERYEVHDMGEVEVRGMVVKQHIYTM